MLVDDEATNLRVLSDALADMGLRLMVARSGEQALNQLARRLPDLILLDILMPGLDGFEVCRRLQASESTESIPIIFMTSLNDRRDRLQAFELGAVDYLAKPVQPEELRARVKTHVRLRTLTKSLQIKNAELERAQQEASSSLEELKRLTSELERTNAGLDREVARRTRELSAAKEALEGELAMRRQHDAERRALQEQIIELSSPVIPIHDDVLVMPLSGIIDQERALRLVEAALEQVTQRGADVMIIDITGVPFVDTEVAVAIVNTSRALRLLGTDTVLTGIRPDVARTLLSLEVSLDNVETRLTLQAGVKYAMTRLNAQRH